MPARPRALRRLLAAAVTAVVVSGGCAPAGPEPPQPPGSPVPGTDPAPRVVAGARNPAPPVEPTDLVAAGRDGLAILAPADGTRLTTRSFVVEGVAPSGARVVLDGPLFLDEAVSADAWGAWALPVTLGRGSHELVFTLEGRAATARTLRIDVTADAADMAPAVVWPPDGATVATSEVALRGSAAPGSRVGISRDDTGGALERLLGIDPSIVADASGRWGATVALRPGANRLLVTAGATEVVHTNKITPRMGCRN